MFEEQARTFAMRILDRMIVVDVAEEAEIVSDFVDDNGWQHHRSTGKCTLTVTGMYKDHNPNQENEVDYSGLNVILNQPGGIERLRATFPPDPDQWSG